MIRARRLAVLLPALSLLAGCATRPPPVVAVPAAAPAVPPSIAPVTAKPAPAPAAEVRRCPAAAEIAKLREARPKPLRDQKMPATTSARVARIAAQLGQYEAQGQWADQVERAFRKCEDR